MSTTYIPYDSLDPLVFFIQVDHLRVGLPWSTKNSEIAFCLDPRDQISDQLAVGSHGSSLKFPEPIMSVCLCE